MMDDTLYGQTEFRQAAGAEFRPGGLALTEELAVACALRPGDRVLDLACGVGSTASYLACRWAVQAWGLDASPDFLEEARGHDWEVEWLLGRAEAIPVHDAHFEAVFAECFLSTVDDTMAVLREIKRVLRPGGRLALSDVYLRNPEVGPISLAPDASCLSRAVGKEPMLALLRESGFSVQMWEDRSDHLKALMAALVFTYGSAAEFWKASTGTDEIQPVLGQISEARPGYYLLVATAD